VKQLEVVASRIKAGATDEQLERAVEGYIRRNGTEARDGFDPMKHFTATTIFRPSKFDANVEGSYLDPPKPKTAPAQGETKTQRRDREERARERAIVEAERASREPEDPEQIGKLIELSLARSHDG
jgi:hypothetical protein